MKALDADLPSSLVSALGIVARRRRGLDDPAEMPRIEQSVKAAQLNAEWLRDYGRCVGLAGRRARAVPPLALQIAVAPLHLAIVADPRFPFPALGLVHLSQAIRQSETIKPAARLDLLAYTTDARLERRGVSFGLVTEARYKGRLVWQSEVRALSMSKQRPPDAGPPREDPDALYARLQPVGEVAIEVPEHLGRAYARISGDRNPIHQHALLARPFGFRRAIVHGTWTLARALASAGLPESAPYELEASFRRPVELPSTIVVCDYLGEQPGERIVRVANPDRNKTHIAIRVRSAAGAEPPAA